MNELKISIITVSYNSEKTIASTIQSVLSQSYPNIEYIIIDGKSQDRTVDIIKSYSDKIAYWISEKDDGIYDAMNKGIIKATGDYIQIIGSDDCLFDKDTIKRVVEVMAEDTDIFSAARYEVLDKYGCQVLVGNESAQNFNHKRLPWMPHTSVFVRSKYMKEHLFDTSYKVAADYKFLLEAYFSNNIKFQYEKFPVAYFSLGGISNRGGDLLKKENERILNELQLKKKIDIRNIVNENNNFWKNAIRHVLDKINALGFFLCLLKGWEKHVCNNKLCRWCGR